MRHNKSFTLIELLVVIFIIALLATIITISVSRVRAKARDTQRVATIKEIQNALELYANDFGSYPECTAAIGGDQWCGTCDVAGQVQWEQALQPLVDNGYLDKIVDDPKINSANGNNKCLTFEYYASNQPNANGNICGGTDIGNFGYVIRFGTEVSSYNLPAFGQKRVPGTEYCVHD